ncbi:hypothetical protein ACFFIZ_11710, partial [Paracoccus rhizosphaerae]
ISSAAHYVVKGAAPNRDRSTRPSLPNEASIRRLVGAFLMEQTEEWTVQRGRYMTLETLAPVCDDVMVSLPAAQRD